MLINYHRKVAPLLTDYLNTREDSLWAQVFQGSIDGPNEVLLETDAVIGIEIIEHLYPDTVQNLPYNIFGFIKPKLVVLTTPNSEFNCLFNKDQTQPTTMRHHDHKFEWTREQFEDWYLLVG